MKRYLKAEKKQEEPMNSSKSLTDTDTSDDTEVDPKLRTSVEEKGVQHYPRISHCNLHSTQPFKGTSKSDGRAWTATLKSKD